jgi:transglutaminase-like putative cysteine protease
MNFDRALQLNTAALAVMGALFLGLGHENVVLPLALAVAALVSATLTGVFGWLRLNRIIANLVALVAVAWSLRNFLRIGSADQLLAIADMLVYLQIVLLFQDKTARVYWQLIVISLLQVVVAAALNQGPLFGILLTVYMILALSALVLLCLHRNRLTGTGQPEPSRLARTGWTSLLGRPQPVPVSAAPDSALASGSFIARQVAVLSCFTLLMAGVFFCATPRLGESAWSASRTGSHQVTGFASDVRLKEFGRVHLSNQLVMRVSLSSLVGRKPYVMFTDPYFHALVLTEYRRDEGGSRWTQPTNQPRLPGAVRTRWQSLALLPTSSHQIRQEYQLEAGASGLYAVMPMHRVPNETPREVQFSVGAHRVRWDPRNESHLEMGQIRYATATSSLRNGRQLHAYPHVNPNVTQQDQDFLRSQRAELLKFDELRFPRLAHVADQVVREAQLESAGPLDRALALERHFLAAGRYRYSLALDFARDLEMDPIEDFVANHRTGHCEYFASALVLMLRSQGIPARLVIGYKGGDFNSLGGYYQVRQKHAHAWVEALVPPGQTPQWELAGAASGGGAWYRLDPTPGLVTASATEGEGGFFDRIGESFDYAELLWRDYVLSLNASKQQDRVFEPFSTQALGSLPAWIEARSLRRTARRLAAQLGFDLQIGGRREAAPLVFDWRTGTAAFGLVILVMIAANAVYLAWRVVKDWGSAARRAGAVRLRRPPRFYRRLKSLLARLHAPPGPGQTARELAAEATQRLSRHLPRSPAAALPGKIVTAYYRVRFGGATLDSHEHAAIEQALGELTPAVHAACQSRP